MDNIRKIESEALWAAHQYKTQARFMSHEEYERCERAYALAAVTPGIDKSVLDKIAYTFHYVVYDGTLYQNIDNNPMLEIITKNPDTTSEMLDAIVRRLFEFATPTMITDYLGHTQRNRYVWLDKRFSILLDITILDVLNHPNISLESLRILSQYRINESIKYIAFDKIRKIKKEDTFSL